MQKFNNNLLLKQKIVHLICWNPEFFQNSVNNLKPKASKLIKSFQFEKFLKSQTKKGYMPNYMTFFKFLKNFFIKINYTKFHILLLRKNYNNFMSIRILYKKGKEEKRNCFVLFKRKKKKKLWKNRNIFQFKFNENFIIKFKWQYV